jgi:DNA-binding NtrC family response regulator
LQSAIETGVVMASGPKVTLRDLPDVVRATGGAAGASAARYAPPRELALDVHANEESLILQALDATGGNVTRAAMRLGISRRTLHRKLNQIRGVKHTPEPPAGGDAPPLAESPPPQP